MRTVVRGCKRGENLKEGTASEGGDGPAQIRTIGSPGTSSTEVGRNSSRSGSRVALA